MYPQCFRSWDYCLFLTMDRLFFFFIIGALSSLFWPVLPPLSTIPVFFTIVLYCIKQCCYSICGVLLGVFWMMSVGHWLNQTQPDKSLFADRIIVTGHVLSVVTEFDNGKFEFQMDEYRIPNTQNWMNAYHKLRLSWRNPDFVVSQGQKLQLEIKLKPRWGLANEAGFDYQKWLLSKNIVATGYVVNSLENRLVQVNQSVRQKLASDSLSYPNENVRWLLALSIGYRGALTPMDWDTLKNTGTAHLVAISGMHLGMVAFGFYWLFILVFAVIRRVVKVHVFSNLRIQALTATLLPCFLYTVLAGFSVPTLRAFIMLVFAWCLFKLHINWKFRRYILVSLSGFVIAFPLSIFSMSFWLSFSAIVIICFLLWRFPYRAHEGKAMAQIFGKIIYFCKMQLWVTLLMVPLTLLFFGGASSISPLVNIIAVPIVTFVLLPLSLVITCLHLFDFPGLLPLLELTLSCFSLFANFLVYCSEFPHAWLSLGFDNHNTLILAAVVPILFMLPKFEMPRGFYVLLLLPLIFGFNNFGFTTFDLKAPVSDGAAFNSLGSNREPKHDWSVDVMDVGQGLGILIRKQGHAVLYDTGAAYPGGFNMAQAVILPILQKSNIQYLDKLFISHDDNDHAGGLDIISKTLPIAELRRSPENCNSDMNFRWKELHFIGLWPDRNFPQHLKSDNNLSCVMRVTDGVNSLLLTGDIEYSVERILVHLHRQEKIDLKSDILVVPHHGSKTSSTASFISAVSPQYSLVSTGFLNRWKMPSIEVVKRYESAGIKFLNTAQTGQITVRLSENSPPQVTSWRITRQPRWYLKPFSDLTP